MKLETLRSALLAAALLGLAAGVVHADDDPLAPPPPDPGAPTAPSNAAKAPPSAPSPSMPTVGESPSKPAPKTPAKNGWGAPTTAPSSGISKDLLPPPTVRNPATGATTGGLSASAPRSGSRYDPSLGPVPSAGTNAPTSGTSVRAAPSPSAGISSLRKNHNVPMPNQGLALRIDVEFSTTSMRGQQVRLAAAFARSDTGATIRSLVPAFAGQAGNIIARTAPVTVQVDSGRYRASLWVPYGAFPTAQPGASYGVNTLVQLQTGDGARVLAHSSTTFTVHGPAAP